MILAIDIGNTNIVLGCLEREDDVTFVERLSTDRGRTVLEYATEIRIERAKELLLTTRMTVREISEALGYSTSSSFIRRFKQITGETPREFGKRAE